MLDSKSNQTAPMFSEYPDILTVYQMKDILHIGLTLAYKLLKSGEIKHRKIGRDYKIPKQSVINYLEKN